MNFTNIFLKVLFCTALIISVQCRLDWLNHLTKCVLRDRALKMISIQWIQDTKQRVDEVSQILADLQKNIPTIVVDSNLNYHETYESLLQSSYLFISAVEISEKYNSTKLQRTLEEAVYAGTGAKMQKNFVIVYHSENIPNKIIKTALTTLLKKYLDAPIKVMEVYNNNVKKIATLHNYESTSTALIHSYDYFKESYSVTDIFKIQNIFDTRKNLQNQTLTMTLEPNPPNLNAQLNSDGCYDPETLAGPEGLILKHIAKTNNFKWRILRVSYNLPKNQTFNESCTVYEPLKELIKNRADIQGNFGHVPYLINLTALTNDGFVTNYLNYLSKIYIRRSDPLIAVTPIFYRNGMTLSKNFLVLFVTTIVIVIILKITVRLMKFDFRLWNVETMLYAIFGMGIDTRKAINTTERIILVCILLLSMIYSVSIIDQLLDIKFELNQPLAINTIEELDEYGLTLMTEDYNKFFLLESQDPVVMSLARNAFTTAHGMSDKNCTDNLVFKSYKNLTCIQYPANAESLTRMSILRHGEANIQIVKEYVVMQWSMIFTRPMFMHAERFEKVVQYLSEAGLIDKWYKTEMIQEPDEKNLINDVNEVDRRQELKQILAIAIVGYILSFIILLGELIFSRFKLKIKSIVFKSKNLFNLGMTIVREFATKIVSFFKKFDQIIKAALDKLNRSANVTKIN